MSRWFIVVLLLYSQLANATVVVDISTDDFAGKYIGEKTYWYRGDQPINTIASSEFDKFTKGDRPVLSFGFEEAVYWYRVSLKNPTAADSTLYFHDPLNNS